MTAVEEIVAAEDTVVPAGTGAEITEAPTGIRGAEGFAFWFGRRTGAKASAADHPVYKTQKPHKGAV